MRKEQRGRQDRKSHIQDLRILLVSAKRSLPWRKDEQSCLLWNLHTPATGFSSIFIPLRRRYFAISNFFTSTWMKSAFLRNHVRSQIKWQETCRSKYRFCVMGVCPEFTRQTLHWGRRASDSTNHTSCLQNDDNNLKCAQIHNSSVIQRSYFFSFCTHSSVI